MCIGRTLDHFRQVKGVGEKKIADYGEAFLKAINAYCKLHELSQDVSHTKANANSTPPRSSGNASAIAAFELFRQGATITEVAERMNRAHSTVAGYLSEFLRHDKVVDPSPWVATDVADLIEKTLEQESGDRLKPIHERLGGEISYEQIRIVATCRKNRERT